MEPTHPIPNEVDTPTPQPVSTNQVPVADKAKSNKNIFLIGGLIIASFLIASVIMLVVFIGFINNGNNKEDEFVKLMEDSIVKNEKPSIFWVSNSINNDESFKSILELLRGVVSEGGFSEVSSYRNCDNIINSSRYNTYENAQFCVAELCNPSNLNCIYIIGYSNNKGNDSSLRSFDYFDNQDQIDAEIESLLSS